MKQLSTADLRVRTVDHWAGFVHARGEQDVARVHAFQALRRAKPEGGFTDDEVTAAYGGRGWAPTPSCVECGARDDSNVLFGPNHDISLCVACVVTAAGLTAAPTPDKPGLFSRLFKGA